MKGISKLGWLCSAVLSLGLMATACWADEIDTPNVTGVTARGIDLSDRLDGAYDGSTRITINNVPFQAHSSSSPMNLIGPGSFRGEVMLLATRVSTFDLGAVGTLVTIDELHIQFVPAAGWFFVYGTLHVLGGTGIFAHAEGDLDLYGQIHFAGGISKFLSLDEGPLTFELLPTFDMLP